MRQPASVNRDILLRALRRRAPVSRIDLSKQTGISKPAVTRTVSALIDEGLVVEARLGDAGSQGGRRPTLLDWNPGAGAGLGCMLKVGEVVGCLAGLNGQVEQRRAIGFDPLSDAEDVVESMLELLESLAEENTPDRPLLGLGVSVPGLVDDVGRVLSTPHMPGWRNLPLAELLEARLDLPAYVENESRVQAVAEAWIGSGRGTNSFVCLEAGVGISAGVVINGELWRGVNSLAGEIGHTRTAGNGDRCYCDSRGCWELGASTTHLLNNVKTASIARSDELLYQDTDLTMERLVAAADEGDEVALREIEAHADGLALGISNLVLSYDPERIILHGESVLLGDRLIEMLRRRVADRFSLWFDYDAPIMLTELGIDGALVGAVSLALHGAWGFGDPTAHIGGALTR